MKIITTIEQMKNEMQSFKAQGFSIGFVPTMGALHEGHLELVRQSNAENDVTVVSIFVNQTQFNDKKDFENYPVTIEQDRQLLAKADTAVLFLPKHTELYHDFYYYRVTENNFSQILCGAHRPGHFDGVLTVVMKLLNLARADRAYFGEKDFQQLELVKGMAKAFFMQTEIIACATVRESDGLALSSRNRRLTSEERNIAREFPRILAAEGLTNAERISKLKTAGFEVDYIDDINGRRFGAVKIGNVRLIDNIAITKEVSSEAPNPL
jgi:pantoate--beta-alanine ligase